MLLTLYAYIDSQRYLTNCHRNLLLNLMRRCHVCLEQPSDSKIYYGFVVDEFYNLVHTINSQWSEFPTAGHDLKQTKCPAVRNIHRIPTEILSQAYLKYLVFLQKCQAILKSILVLHSINLLSLCTYTVKIAQLYRHNHL